ncbi:MAG: N5-glutamine methyltransferase family protein [Micrococcaceae bacterium]
MSDLAAQLRDATARLHAAGVESARHDARILLSHALNVSPGRLDVLVALGRDPTAAESAHIEDLLAQREQRIPLQLILGSVDFGGVEIRVAPGVFIPRPETELLADEALNRLRRVPPGDCLSVIDLCTGTGALAAALAFGMRSFEGLGPFRIHAVEIDAGAHALAQRNLENWDVELHLGDATRPETIPALHCLLGSADVVVSNPPYVPEDQPVTQQEAQADPALALYGGSGDGTRIPLQIAASAARLLRPGGLFMMEHDETHGSLLVDTLDSTGSWREVTVHHDLADRPRFLSAVRSDADAPRPEAPEVQE